ncbi:hypothetical protein HY490_04370 [Candidatus Woesearchaeota archaeon]|nr:hypothetical protein [Candidatus Woesearchaeota archaeon]
MVLERKKYKCEMCKWKFTRNFVPTLCPYCGREAIVLDAVDKEPLVIKR